MKGELRNRRKQFWAMLLAIAMVVGLMPYGGVKADDYTCYYDKNDPTIAANSIFNAKEDYLENKLRTDSQSGNPAGTEGGTLKIMYFDLGSDDSYFEETIQLGNKQKLKKYSETTFKMGGTGIEKAKVLDENHQSDLWRVTNIINSSGNITIELRAIEKFRINWKVNGGSFVPGYTPKSAYETTAITIPTVATEDKIVRPGYTFAGWELELPNGTTIDPNVSETIRGSIDDTSIASIITLNGGGHNIDINFNAKWTENNYKVNFNPNHPTDNTVVVTPASTDGYIPYETGSIALPSIDPVGGYALVGWSSQNNATSGYATNPVSLKTIIAEGPTENASDVAGASSNNKQITLYGVWKPRYTITYNSNEGTGSIPAVTETEGKQVNIATAEGNISRTGYTFSGWNTKADGSGTAYGVGYTYTLNSVDGNLTLYATWSKNSYAVTWQNEDGTLLENDVTVPYDTKPSYDGTVPTKAPTSQYTYTFDGWQKDGTGTVYAATTIPNVSDNVTYKAHFSSAINNYTVIWKNEDGTTLETDAAVLYGTVPVYDGIEPAKAEDVTATYAFTGWNDGVNNVAKGTAFPAVTGTTTYTAVFASTPKVYTVTFDNQGHGTAPAVQNKNYGAFVEEPAALSEMGYTFGGWFKDVACTVGQEWNFATDTVTGPTTLYAMWTQINTGSGGESGNGGGGTVPSPTPDPTPIITSEPEISTTPTPTPTPETTPTPTVTPSVTPTPTPEVTPTPGAIVTPAPAQETKFSTVLARLAKIKKTSITVKWKKQKDVDGYEVYGVKCNAKGMKNKHILLATLGPEKNKFKAKNLEKNTYYKFYVDAYKYIDGEKVIVSRSAYLHGTTLSKKYGMASGVKLYVVDEEGNKTEVTGGHVSMKLGDVMQLLGVEQNDSGKKIKHHRGVRYEAKIEEIADVNYKKGLVEATQVGTTEIYAFAQNGVFAKIVLEVYDEE